MLWFIIYQVCVVRKKGMGFDRLFLTDYVPLDMVLRHLGIDLGSLHRSSAMGNYYPSKYV